MDKTKGDMDICETCNNAGHCSITIDNEKAVWECDEFSGYRPDDIMSFSREYGKEQGGVMSILEKIQAKYSYLPEKALRIVAEQTGRSLVDIYGVATFYRFFSLQPRGKHLISVCLGTACHVRGAREIVDEMSSRLQIAPGATTKDGEFTFETVNCLGACALGPIVLADGVYFSKVKVNDVKTIIEKVRAGLNDVPPEEDNRIFPLEVACYRCNHSLMEPEYRIDNYPSIRVTVSFENKHGWMRFSSLYGSYTVESRHHIPEDALVNFFCPHCHAELTGAAHCMNCGAAMVPMIVRGGGVVQICSRRGCRGRMLDVNGVNF